jgi:hypothetical protein
LGAAKSRPSVSGAWGSAPSKLAGFEHRPLEQRPVNKRGNLSCPRTRASSNGVPGRWIPACAGMRKRLSALRTPVSRPFCLCVAADCYCAGAAAAGASAGLPVRRVCRRAWRLWRRSLRCLRRDFRRFVPSVPVGSGAPRPVAGAVGFGTAGAASCASATDGSSTPENAKPSVAPKPSRESIFRRETFSISTSLFRGFSSPHANQNQFA